VARQWRGLGLPENTGVNMNKKKKPVLKKSESLFPDHGILKDIFLKEPRASILKIVEEDILRIIGEEKNRKSSAERIQCEIKASSSYIYEAIKDLEKNDMIRLGESRLGLTEQGWSEAAHILKKHNVLEDYFKEKRDGEAAHKAADIIEHYVSVEVINDIKKLSTFQGEDVPLVKYELDREDLITDIEFPSGELFERIVSMGILPGEKIKILHKIPDGVVVDVGGKKIALGEEIAEGVRVLG
jgi:Mn-dependent DtxR family transcriptional regulator